MAAVGVTELLPTRYESAMKTAIALSAKAGPAHPKHGPTTCVAANPLQKNGWNIF